MSYLTNILNVIFSIKFENAVTQWTCQCHHHFSKQRVWGIQKLFHRIFFHFLFLQLNNSFQFHWKVSRIFAFFLNKWFLYTLQRKLYNTSVRLAETVSKLLWQFPTRNQIHSSESTQEYRFLSFGEKIRIQNRSLCSGITNTNTLKSEIIIDKTDIYFYWWWKKKSKWRPLNSKIPRQWKNVHIFSRIRNFSRQMSPRHLALWKMQQHYVPDNKKIRPNKWLPKSSTTISSKWNP